MSQNYNTFALADVVLDMHQGINTAANKVVYADNGCSIIQSKNFTSGSLDLNDVKYLNSDDVVKYGDKYTPKIGDILFSNIGTVGKSIVVETNSKFMFAWNVFRIQLNKDLVDAYYLKYYLDYLLSIGFYESLFTGGTVKFINKKKFGGIQIPLPPLPVQKQIAAVLEKADTLRGQCQKMEQELNILAQSVFLDNVGDNANSFNEWQKMRIEELCEPVKGSMRTGPFGSDLKHSEFVDEGFPVIGIDNAVHNEFRWGERRYINDEKYEKLKRYTVYPKDIIVTIMGTTGRVAVIPDDIPVSISTKHLAVLTVEKSIVLPEFIADSLKYSTSLRRQIKKKNKGAIMDGLNLGIIKSLEVQVPPIDLQEEYFICSNQIRKNLEQNQTTLIECESEFNSLMQRAFKGELALKDIA